VQDSNYNRTKGFVVLYCRGGKKQWLLKIKKNVFLLFLWFLGFDAKVKNNLKHDLAHEVQCMILLK